MDIFNGARIVQLQGEASVKENGVRRFDRHITVQSLQRKTLLESAILNGFVTAFHTNPLARGSSLEPGLMSGVIITYVLPSGGGISWSAWMQVQSFFQDSGGGGGWSNYYMLTANPDISGGGGAPVMAVRGSLGTIQRICRHWAYDPEVLQAI